MPACTIWNLHARENPVKFSHNKSMRCASPKFEMWGLAFLSFAACDAIHI